jgi:hypothetical protein
MALPSIGAMLLGNRRRPNLVGHIGAVMKLLKKLNNPFLIGIQGFLAGAVLFFATHPELADRKPAPAPAQLNQVGNAAAA